MRAKKVQIAIILVSLSCISIVLTALERTIAVPSITGANMDMPKPLITPPTMDMPDPSPKVTVVEGKKQGPIPRWIALQ